MNIHVIQHVPFEGPGSIQTWADKNGHPLTATRPYLQEKFPPIEDIDLLVVMGGPMNIYEEDMYPWLVAEKRFLGKAIAGGRSILGICLGAQLLADVLGARVFANTHKEIGWFRVEKTADGGAGNIFSGFPKTFEAFHWHGDTFDMPRGAVHIARSCGCENQAFIYDERIIGLQFHIETTLAATELLLAHCGDEIVPGRYIQEPQAMVADPERFAAINALLYRLLDKISSHLTA